MNQLDLLAIPLLRRMAREQSSLADMVRALLPRDASSGYHPIEVLNSFRQAFGLTLAQAKPITDWLAYGGGDKADAAVVVAAFARTRGNDLRRTRVLANAATTPPMR